MRIDPRFAAGRRGENSQDLVIFSISVGPASPGPFRRPKITVYQLQALVHSVDGDDSVEKSDQVAPGALRTTHNPHLFPRKALVLSGVAVVVGYAMIYLLLQLPGIPYNVRELFVPGYLHIRVVVFSIVLVWISFAPAWIADWLVRFPRYIPFVPVWSAAVSLVSWFLLQFAVTRESVGDILGSPVLNWAGDSELICRFLALHGQFVLTVLVAGVMIGGVSSLGWREGFKRGATTLLWGLPWMILAWSVVTKWACTDNLTELIRNRPFKWVGSIHLAALTAVISGNAAALGRALFRAKLGRKIVAIIVTLLLVGPGWGLLYLGLDPAVTKYGATFPAIRFLLGSTREAEISWVGLFLRWSAVQLAVVGVLTWGQMIALSLRPWDRRDVPIGGVQDP